VLALTKKGDWVLDPFAGVGSTILASLMNDRNVVGIEKLKKYKDIGINRIKEFENGILRFRPLNRPIYDHAKSKLSQVPPEFDK
jgi:DNA modification methylase